MATPYNILAQWYAYAKQPAGKEMCSCHSSVVGQTTPNKFKIYQIYFFQEY